MTHPFDPRPVIREDGLAERWGKSTRTLARLRRRKCGPAWFRIGGTVFYRLEDVHAFEASLLQGNGEAR
jgi:hypothetical protein